MQSAQRNRPQIYPPTEDSRINMRPLGPPGARRAHIDKSARRAHINPIAAHSRTDPDELRDLHLRKLRAGLAEVLKTNAFWRSR